jgi:hypothetical protein
MVWHGKQSVGKEVNEMGQFDGQKERRAMCRVLRVSFSFSTATVPILPRGQDGVGSKAERRDCDPVAREIHFDLV